MIQVAIYSRAFDEMHHDAFQFFFEELKKYPQIHPVIYNTFYIELQKHIHIDEGYAVFNNADDLSPQTEIMICLGGDGTILDTITLIRQKNISIMGINFGRLGFLATIGRNEIKEAFEVISNRTYVIDDRTLIHLDADIPLFDEVPYGLNDFTIHKRDTDSMIKIDTYLNGEFLNTYWADGIIVATPTGSTGYSLSCGGPIVFPDSKSFVIAAVSPHNLSSRHIIVPDNSVISFEVESRSNEFLCTIDTRRMVVKVGVSLAIRKEHFGVKILRLSENSFLQTIQNKLVWGIDKRN